MVVDWALLCYYDELLINDVLLLAFAIDLPIGIY